MGSARIRIDIPYLVDLYRQGRLKLDELISGRFPLEEVNAAIAGVIRGDALRNVIVFPMKITGLKTWIVGNPPPGFGGRYFVFLKLVTDNGIEGVGEVYAATFHPKVVVQMIEDVVERHVIGTDPFRIEALWRKVYGRGYSLRPDISLMGVMSAHRDGLVGHRRQGGRQAGLRAAGRPRARAAAQLHLHLPAGRRERARSTPTRTSRRSARPSMWRRASPR